MCNILINQPTAILSGSTITSITVTGTTANCGCANVHITIQCIGSPGASTPLTVPVTSGTFSATFTGAALQNCVCNNEILVNVRCDDHPIFSQAFRLDCNPCSDIRVFGMPEKVCINAPFQFQIAHGSTGTVNVNIDFGDNKPTSVIVVPNVGNTPMTVPVPPYIYTSPGTYTILIWITGCPPQQYTIMVVDCPTNCCPNAIAVITSEVKEKCNPDHETKNVKVDAVITPTPQPGCPTNIQAEMWIDNNLVATGSGSSPFTLSHQADYTCLDHNVVIKYPGSNCPDDGGVFCVSVCEKPACKTKRRIFEISMVVALISWILYFFGFFNAAPATVNPLISAIQPYLRSLAILATIVAILLYFFWRPCSTICKKCPLLLAMWQIALATFLGFLMLSKTSLPQCYSWISLTIGGTWGAIVAAIIIVLFLLIMLIIVILLYLRWVGTCCPTKCEKWTYLFEALLNICGISIGIIVAYITWAKGLPTVNLYLILWEALIWAAILVYVSDKKDASCSN